MAATRGPQVVLEGYARTVARGGAGKTMRDNIQAMDALVIAGLTPDGNSVDGKTKSGGPAYDHVVAQFPREELTQWEVPAPVLQGLGSGDVANIIDYGGGVGGDDALAMRKAIASGSKIIYVPPGTYVMKSAVPQPPPLNTHAAPTCFQIMGQKDTFIYAYGATFVLDPAVVPLHTGVTFCSIGNDAKNCGMLGGTFVGDRTNAVAVGVFLVSTTGVVLRDLKFTSPPGASAPAGFQIGITGIYFYDTLIDNVQIYNATNGYDLGHAENLTLFHCLTSGDPRANDSAINTDPHAFSGLSCHYDFNTVTVDNVVTYEDGVTKRELRYNNCNDLRIIDSIFQGYDNGIIVDSVQGMLVSRTIVRGKSPLLTTGAGVRAGITAFLDDRAATEAGRRCVDITIEDCDIYGNGATGGGVGAGINIAHDAALVVTPPVGAEDVTVRGCRIYDNFGWGIYSNFPPDVKGCVLSNNDYRTRTTDGTGGPQTDGTGVPGGPPGIPQNIYTTLVYAGIDEGRFTSVTTSQGVHMGRIVAPTTTDLSNHLDLYGGGVGLNVTSGRLNIASSSSTTRVVVVQDGVDVAAFSAAGMNGCAIGALTPSTGRFTTVGFNNVVPIAKPAVTGSRAGNAAVASLLSQLAAYGLITDSSTA